MNYLLMFYVPSTHLDSVKSAIFAAGAGQNGNYDCCAWETLGQGQFRPLAGSQPTIGTQNNIETVSEYKVETICTKDKVDAVISALRRSHPYEAPAFSLLSTID